MRRFLTQTILVTLPVVLFANQAMAFDTNAKQALMIDYNTGAVLLEKNSQQQMTPSSMSKLMTLYMVFERLKAGNLKLTDTLTVSEKAWRMGGSKMFVRVGDQVKVEDLIRGIIVQSGNDACVVFAEGLMGNEAAFAEAMTKKAQEIGLTDSHFADASGMPDPKHYMTARDLAILGQRIIGNFPEYYHYFSELEFTYNNITQPNRNLLLDRKLGVDGLKTGHTEDGGFGMVVSGKQGERRLILVLNGLSSMSERAHEAELIMQYGFRNFDDKTIAKAGQPIDKVDVWYGKDKEVPLVSARDLTISFPIQFKDSMKFELKAKGPVPAPIKKGDHLADLVITVPDMGVQTVPLVAGNDVERLSWFGRLFRTAKYKWFKH
ncbi:MAG: D-alanyl-D-alanine carboxypeptidase [Alphaproteobacteria bacterium]|nr:D-alanyl-D-alanine carboxypeptidase [Alphaproteobacteria bacterium]